MFCHYFFDKCETKLPNDAHQYCLQINFDFSCDITFAIQWRRGDRIWCDDVMTARQRCVKSYFLIRFPRRHHIDIIFRFSHRIRRWYFRNATWCDINAPFTSFDSFIKFMKKKNEWQIINERRESCHNIRAGNGNADNAKDDDNVPLSVVLILNNFTGDDDSKMRASTMVGWSRPNPDQIKGATAIVYDLLLCVVVNTFSTHFRCNK